MPVSPRSESKLNAGPVLETVLQIMDQGPQPMRNMRPTKKNPNSADNFDANHQSGYESYYQGKDRKSQVDAHNDASPKMKDELERRRSISKPKAPSVVLAAKSNVYYDPRCRACQKLKQAAEAKKRNTKKSIEKKRKTQKSRITKKRRANSRFRLAKMRTNKGSQYCSMYYNKGTSADLNTKVDENSELIFFSTRNSNASRSSQGALTNPSQNNSRSEVISQNPDTSVNSLSSYNSNMSLDHEPMVSNRQP